MALEINALGESESCIKIGEFKLTGCCRQSAPAMAARSGQAFLWARFQPFLSAVAAIIAEFVDEYDEFLGEETKRKWEWKRRAEQERVFWGAAVAFASGAFYLKPPLYYFVCHQIDCSNLSPHGFIKKMQFNRIKMRNATAV